VHEEKRYISCYGKQPTPRVFSGKDLRGRGTKPRDKKKKGVGQQGAEGGHLITESQFRVLYTTKGKTGRIKTSQLKQ